MMKHVMRCAWMAMDARRGAPPAVICGQAPQRRRRAIQAQPFGASAFGRIASLRRLVVE